MQSLSRLRLVGLVACSISIGSPGSGALAADGEPARAGISQTVTQIVTKTASTLGNANIDDVDARIAGIDRRLRDARSAGRLTQTQYERFNGELKRIIGQEAIFRANDGQLSLWESLRLSFDLDRLIKDSEASMTDRQSGYMDVPARQAELQKRLAEAYSLGRLTRQEHDEIDYQLQGIDNRIASSKAHNKSLSIADTIRYMLELDALSKRLTRTVHDRQVSLTSIDEKKSELEARIAEGVKDGKIDGEEEKALRAEYSRIVSVEALLRKLDRPLTAEEQLSLALSLEKLSGQIEADMQDKASVLTLEAIETRRNDADKLLAKSLSDGLVTVTEAQVYRTDLEDIESRERTAKNAAKAAASAGSVFELDPVTAQNLLIEIERVRGSIERAGYNKKPIWPGIDGSIAEIDKKLAEARSASRLEESVAVSIKAELDNVVNRKNEYMSSQGLSSSEALSLASMLEQLNLKLARSVEDRQIAYIPDVPRRKKEVSARLGEGIFMGGLSIDEAQSLIAEYERINARQASFTADGALDEREKLTLALDLEKLATRIEREIRDNPYENKSLAQQRKDIDQAIATGVLNGTISNQEMTALKAEASRIDGFHQTAAQDGAIDAYEAFQIAQSIAKLNRDVQLAIKNSDTALPDIAKREAELYQRITEGVMQGRLGAKEADDLKRDFYRVMDNEAKYRSSGGLSFGEQAALAIELEKLANSIESSMKETNAVLPDVDTRQAELDKKLANALAGGLVSTTQVSEITRELDRIAREEVNYRFSGNGLSYAESSSLMAELERVDNRINTMLAGRKVQWSGIDNRLLEAREEIEEGVAARRLSAAQASELKAELDRIAQAKLAFEASGGGLTVAETSSLVRDLERFNVNLNARLGKISQKIAWTDIDARQARVEAKLNQSKMPVATANRVKRELKDLAIKKALYRASGNAFSYKELTSLAQTLDRLDGMVGIKVQ